MGKNKLTELNRFGKDKKKTKTKQFIENIIYTRKKIKFLKQREKSVKIDAEVNDKIGNGDNFFCMFAVRRIFEIKPLYGCARSVYAHVLQEI